MLRAYLACSCLLLAWSALFIRNVSGEERRPASSGAPLPGQLAPDDPLRQALEALQQETKQLREVVEGRGTTPAMAAPAKSPSPRIASPVASSNASLGLGRPAPAAVTQSSAGPAVLPAAPQNVTDHWSFQPIQKPAPPTIKNNTWPRIDLDRFVLAEMESAGIQPTNDADAAQLCRRVYLDLTGLPPTPEQASAFAAQAGDEKAYAELVDQLLASPRFGERWGRHWLDVVRYSDSVGRAWNAPLTYAWRYRDYVVDAFNADTPYDRFIAEQLAGDLLPAADAEQRRTQLTAGGMLGLGSVDLQTASYSAYVMDQIDDQIDVTTRAFLGLTIACARCHDHKYEPISMHDYYALAGIFYSTTTLPGVSQRHDLGAEGYVDPRRLVQLPPGRNPAPPPDAGRPIVHSMSDYQQAWSSNRRDARYTTDPNLAMGTIEGDVRDCELRLRGEPSDLGPTIPRGDLRIPSLPRMPSIPDHVSGRLELARWIGSPQNPLTARVMANRVWQHLFGQGLVRTVDDFGATGEPPTHPQLLDWLATEFVRENWSVKRLIRTIVLSRTYRLASTGSASNEKADPHNRLLWRSNLRALELEPLRDSMLFVAGTLREDRPYGIQVAGIGSKQGNRNLLTYHDPFRTIYLPVMRAHVPDVYSVFNFPDPSQVQGLRAATTVAPQALFFMNDSFAVECATDAARRLLNASVNDDTARVRLAFLHFYGRLPKPAETQAALRFLAELQPSFEQRDDRLYRWSTLAQALFSSAEFRYVR